MPWINYRTCQHEDKHPTYWSASDGAGYAVCMMAPQHLVNAWHLLTQSYEAACVARWAGSELVGLDLIRDLAEDVAILERELDRRRKQSDFERKRIRRLQEARARHDHR